MSEKDIILRRYLSDKKRFTDLINGIAFGGQEIIHTEEVEDRDSVSVFHGTAKRVKRERDIIKKIVHNSQVIYIACENQMEIHYGMPVRTILYDGMTYNEQLYEMKQKYRRKKDLKKSSEFLSGMKETDSLVAVITFVCYYGIEAWDSHLSIKDMVKIPEGYHKLESYLTDNRLNLVPMMKIDPNVFHGELRELIALLQCNSDIQKIEDLVRTDHRYRYLSEETFEVLMVLSDAKISFKEWKPYAKMNQEGKVEYDMCRAFEQLEARGRQAGIQQGIQQGMQQGLKRGEQKLEQMNQLYFMLISENRYEDLKKAVEDKAFREELYQKMQLI
ncbi:MAG: hypothetical protein Q4D45_02960 [Lachnospiraceae bacterium]|nr:hypothetical protein [Lachnospiraceae bacterium]